MGVILYISSVNDEVAYSKRSTGGSSGGGMDKFNYHYGWAFFFGGATFVCAMAAAVSNISLYLQRYSHFDDMILIVPTTVSGSSGTTGGVESSSDTAGIYRPVRWTDTDDDRRYVDSATGAMARPSDVKGHRIPAEYAEKRYKSSHSISLPL